MNWFHEDKAVGRLAEAVALACGFHPAEARQIRIAAALHDIGKLKIPADILNKPGKLTALEFEIVKTHTIFGAEMLASVQGVLGEMARATALYHHEWYDGGGYWGRRANEVPRYVPVVSISDVFVALISERPYKAAWPVERALAYIQNQAGTQFDPALVEAFIPLVRKGGIIPAIFGRECDGIAGRIGTKDRRHHRQGDQADREAAGEGSCRLSAPDAETTQRQADSEAACQAERRYDQH